MTDAEVKIRSASRSNAEAISRMISDLSRKFITPDYSREGAETLLSHLTPTAILNMMSRGTQYWLAESSDGVVGVVGVTSSRTHLYHLFVAESHFRRGIGRRLWDHALAECRRDRSIEEFTVNSSLYAVPFYRSLEFIESGPLDERNGVICQPMRLTIV